MLQRKLYPEFSWSLSRHKTLMDCSRKYGFHYYFSHSGWFNDSPDLAKQTYRLKKITNLPILFGEVLHSIIEKVIKDYQQSAFIPAEEELVSFIRKSLNTAFIDSTRHQEEWTQRPKYYKMLHEIYYYGELEEADIKEMEDRLAVCVKNFLASKSFTDITSKKEMQFVQSEEFRTLTLFGVKVFVVIDFLYKDLKEDKWIIVDWKTGKETMEDRNQLALYALYLKEKYKVPLEKIEIRNEYLLTGNCQQYYLKEIDLQHVLQRMEMSLTEMGKYVLDEDTNEPIDLEFFSKTEYTKKCLKCNYKELCEEGC
ncbi:radical SAM protein with 4Fe4S-binding SPASM domain [Evansella vedderi]|uniref:Radical SAM protein with 4Fe4S-binding SPASM domain n=1 Tax=Evansella vedderi TaxID=38282 RepID=A0ABT9ZPF9_9BACI|nr:PD-(D/E)XK nuclease family protein [Evansella vedderi]MDQ0253124.1 radical SAM protein with 4Fe4S-binding SPASM domain [Evansella vedderi]